MFAAESHTGRHHIAIAAMACLCVLLGGPSCAAGAESLFIAGATYCEPGVSGPGWAWTDAGHLELDGYAGDATAAEGDLVLTLAGQKLGDGVECARCGHHAVRHGGVGQPDASRHRVPGGDGLAVRDPRFAGARGGRLRRRCPGGRGRYYGRGGRRRDRRRHGRARRRARRRRGSRVRSGRAPTACICRMRALALARLAVGFPSTPRGSMRPVPTAALRVWAGRLCPRGLWRLLAGHLVLDGVMDASSAVAPHVVVEPDMPTPPAGETDRGDVPGDSAGKSPADANPAAGDPTTGPTANPSLKPAAATTKTNITTKRR